MVIKSHYPVADDKEVVVMGRPDVLGKHIIRQKFRYHIETEFKAIFGCCYYESGNLKLSKSRAYFVTYKGLNDEFFKIHS